MSNEFVKEGISRVVELRTGFFLSGTFPRYDKKKLISLMKKGKEKGKKIRFLFLIQLLKIPYCLFA